MIIGVAGKKQHGKDTVCKIIQYLFLKDKVENTPNFDELPPSSNVIISSGFQQTINSGVLSEFGFEHFSGWYRKLFADKLKDIICRLINCTREQLEDNTFKETPLGEEWDMYRGVISKDRQKPIYKTFDSKEEAELEANKVNQSIYDSVYKTSLTPRLLLQLLGTECGRQIIHPNIWVNALMSEYKRQREWIRKDISVDDMNIQLVREQRPELIDFPNWIITDVRFPNEVKAIKDRQGIVFRVTNPRIESKDEHESETALDNVLWEDKVNIYNDGTMEDLIEKVKDRLKRNNILQ